MALPLGRTLAWPLPPPSAAFSFKESDEDMWHYWLVNLGGGGTCLPVYSLPV